MFQNTLSANPDVSNWNASSIIQAGSMFNNAAIANPNCSNWNVISLVQAGSMFNDSALSIENLTLIYENWSQLTLRDTGFVEFGAAGIQYNSSGQAGRDIITNTYNWTITDGGVVVRPFILEVDTTDRGQNGTTGSNINQFNFGRALGDYDVVAKQNGVAFETFNNLSGEQTITLSRSGVMDLEVLPRGTNGVNYFGFRSKDNLKLRTIKQWGDIEWSSFNSSFHDCESLIVSATDAPDLNNVDTLGTMFRDCFKIEGDFSNWDVSNVTKMDFTFYNIDTLNTNISNWDVSNVTNMYAMFGDINNYNNSNVDITNWDVSSVTDMRLMFRNLVDFNQDLSSWCVSQIPSKPSNFDIGTSSWTLPRPNWGASCGGQGGPPGPGGGGGGVGDL
jgi:surface protein